MAWNQPNQSSSGGGGGSGTVTSVTAGTGMTQTGTSTINPTLNVIANADGSIVANANDIQVGVISDTQHGNRGGGALHANVVAAGAAGFMTGADKTKLDGIEALADVTDAANVQAAISGDQSGARNALTPASANEVLYRGSGGVIDGSPAMLVDPATGYPALLPAGVTMPAQLSGHLGFQSFQLGSLPAFFGTFDASLRSVIEPDRLFWHISGVLPGFTTTFNYFGHTTYVASDGTVSTPGPAVTSAATRRIRTQVASAASAGSRNVFRSNHAFLFRDSTYPGFLLHLAGVGTPTLVATPQCYFGFSDRTTPAANPSTLFNFAGLGCDDTDTNWQIMHNDAAGTATRIDLGANFPISTTAFYDVWFYAPRSSATVYYYVRRLDSAFEASGTITTNLPASSVVLAPYLFSRNGATASAIAMDFSSIFVASPREGAY